MYIEISEYFYLFEVDITYFIGYLNNGIFLQDLSISWELHYMIIKEWTKYLIIRFFVIYDPNRQATPYFRGDVCAVKDWLHMFSFKRRIWKVKTGLGYEMTMFSFNITNLIIGQSTRYYNYHFWHYVLLSEVLQDNLMQLRYLEVLSEFLEELISCIQEKLFLENFVNFYYYWFFRFLNIILFKNLYFNFMFIYIFYAVFNFVMYFLLSFVFFFYDKYFLFVKFNNFLNYLNLMKRVMFAFYTFYYYSKKIKQKSMLDEYLTIYIVRYKRFRKLNEILFFYRKSISLLKRLFIFDRNFLHLHIILSFVDIVVKFFVSLNFLIFYFPVYLAKYVFYRFYKSTYFMNYLLFAKIFGEINETGLRTYLFIYGYLKQNKRIRNSMDIIKEKFDEYIKRGKYSDLSRKERWRQEKDIAYTYDKIFDQFFREGVQPKIFTSLFKFKEFYYLNYIYLVFFKNKLFFDFGLLFNDFISKSLFFIFIKLDHTYYFMLHKFLYNIRINIFSFYFNKNNSFFLLFHFYYVILSLLNLLNMLLFEREILRVIFFYRLSLFYVFFKNLYFKQLLNIFAKHKIFSVIKKDIIIYYLKIAYVFYFRYVFYYAFYIFFSKIPFFFILFLLCGLIFFDINIFFYFVFHFFNFVNGSIDLFSVYKSVSINSILLVQWLDLKNYLACIFSSEFIDHKFSFLVDKYVLGAKPVLPFVFKKLFYKYSALKNNAWLKEYPFLTNLVMLRELVFTTSKLRDYTVSYASYLFIPMEQHLYLKSLIFWNMLYFYYMLEWVYNYGIEYMFAYVRDRNLLFYIYYYFSTLSTILKFIVYFTMYNFYVLSSLMITSFAFFLTNSVSSLISNMNFMNYYYYHYSLLLDLWYLIIFFFSFFYLIVEFIFIDFFIFGIDMLYGYIFIDVLTFLKQYFLIFLNWWDQIEFTHFFTARRFKKKIGSYLILYKRKWSGGQPLLKISDYFSFESVMYYIHVANLDSFNKKLIGVQGLWNITSGFFLFVIYFICFFFSVFMINMFTNNMLKDKNVYLPNTFFTWRNVNEKNLHKLTMAEDLWATNYKWVNIFYRADKLPEIDNPYKDMNESDVRKTVAKLVFSIRRRDFLRGRKQRITLRATKFSILYNYIDYYIKNRFVHVTNKVGDMFAEKVIGSRNKFEYLEDTEFSFKYPYHYNTKAVFDKFRQYGDSSTSSAYTYRKTNRLWYNYGIEYLLGRNNKIINRFSKEHVLYLNKCYLLFMQSEENKIDLIDYAFLDNDFYDSFLSVSHLEKAEKNSPGILRDAALARAKGALFFEGETGANDMKFLRTVDFFFEWLNSVDNYFNNYFLFYIYEFKKAYGVMRTTMELDEMKKIFVEDFYDKFEFYTVEDYEQREGSDYYMQKEVFRRMGKVYRFGDDDKNYATLEMKEEDSVFFVSVYMSLILFFCSIFLYYFFFSYKIYIKPHIVYQGAAYVLILLKYLNINLFFSVFSLRALIMPKLTILRAGWRRIDEIYYMFTVTNGSNLSVFEYKFLWIMLYIGYESVFIPDLLHTLSGNCFEFFFVLLLNFSIFLILYHIYLLFFHGLFSKK